MDRDAGLPRLRGDDYYLFADDVFLLEDGEDPSRNDVERRLLTFMPHSADDVQIVDYHE